MGRFDYFKPFYHFENLSPGEFTATIKTFERDFLKLPESIQLIDVESVSTLYSVTTGNIEDLIEILIQVIRRSSSNNALYFDPQILSKVLESYGIVYLDEEAE
ncbi:hypothetical protein [Egbenema bharatensis]|uniref:hypothetical protein n=1 Tax=Egbenema bharatensis TaxID=3463334 RepID=UPI003A8BE63A